MRHASKPKRTGTTLVLLVGRLKDGRLEFGKSDAKFDPLYGFDAGDGYFTSAPPYMNEELLSILKPEEVKKFKLMKA